MEQESIAMGAPSADLAARKRAAVELIAQHGSALRRTARRYSLNTEDAEDAYQRSLEILLTKAPNVRLNELVRWTHTVIKHEALAVRRKRERMLGGVPQSAEDPTREDWVALIPATGDGPDVQAEQGERIARSREALQTLKPAELRALTLLAEGYSYAEIGEMTGWTRTKVNRCLAEGRERFRKLFARSEDGSRCAEMRPLLSAFCDGEATGSDVDAVREHLRACAGCRATMRAYRATPGAAAALSPVLPARGILERLQDLGAAVQSRLPLGGGGGDSAISQVAAAGGTRGAGMAAVAKLLTICAGAAGGAAACVAAGITPAPLIEHHEKAPTIERVSKAAFEEPASEPVDVAPPADPEPAPEPTPTRERAEQEPAPEPAPAPSPAPETSAGAVEYSPPEPASAPASPGGGESSAPNSGSAAGEFGP
ncbi:MAG TPA: sigma-70 family RNA polymerase sigma factor [Solirubrobacterales bacterium]